MTKTVSNLPEIKGWCPGALRPMMSGDGLVVRVRPRGGRLTQAQAAGIADLSLRFGNGLIDLSSRANIQLRGVAEANHDPLIEGLRALGLIDPTTEAESRRNIVVTPFWAPGDGTLELATALSEALAADASPQTPGKFGYAVDCGPVPVLAGTSADIRIERAVDGTLIVRADGADFGAPVTPATATPTALALAQWFLESGGAQGGRGRMAAHLAGGAKLPAQFAQGLVLHNAAPAPVPGPVREGVLLGFEFGQMRAETLSVLAQTGALRTTPWRMLLIEGATDAPDLPGLISTSNDPRLRVIACTGAPACPQALAATRDLARSLAPHVAPHQILHVSGCAKGCAHPGATLLTLVARADGLFDLIRAGTTTDIASLTGLTPHHLTQNPEILSE